MYTRFHFIFWHVELEQIPELEKFHISELEKLHLSSSTWKVFWRELDRPRMGKPHSKRHELVDCPLFTIAR